MLAISSTAGAVHGPGTLDPNPNCQPQETYHVYYGAGQTRAGLWHVYRPTIGIFFVRDGNTLQDCGTVYPGNAGQYPWSDPLTYPLPGSGWGDGVAADFDYDAEYGFGGGFFPGGPWATDSICDYGYFPHHGAVPEIDDIAYPPLNSGAPAVPAFMWGADDTGLGQTGNPLADAGSGYIPTTNLGDATFGDGQMCLTDGAITPGVDADDWLQFCYGDAGQTGTTCIPPPYFLANTYPRGGGDGGYMAFTLTEISADTGNFDFTYNHDHGGYQTTCDPTHPDYVPGSACHSSEIPKVVFVTVAGTITS